METIDEECVQTAHCWIQKGQTAVYKRTLLICTHELMIKDADVPLHLVILMGFVVLYRNNPLSFNSHCEFELSLKTPPNKCSEIRV